MPRTCLHLLAFAALLCSACTPDAPSPSETATTPTPAGDVAAVVTAATPSPPADLPAPTAAAAPPDLLGWWSRPEALASLGLTMAEGAAMAAELDKLERSYQTAQRQLRQVRRTQLLMLKDPKVRSADIKRFNQRNLQHLLTTMLDQDIAARLWVRERLGAEQLKRAHEREPAYFAMRWFRAAPDPKDGTTGAGDAD